MEQRDPALPLAARQIFTFLAYHVAGLDAVEDLGDPVAHARVVFAGVPGLAQPILDLFPEDPADPGPGPDPGADPALDTAIRDRVTPQGLPNGGRRPDILLGSSGTAAQFGLLGRAICQGSSEGPGSEPVYIDTNGCEFTVISGATGSGKSNTLAVYIENHTQHIPNISTLQQPWCAVVLVVHNDNHELLAALQPNQDPRAVRDLLRVHKARPQALTGLRRLLLPSMLDEGQAAYPGLPTESILWHPGQLNARAWELLLGLDEARGSHYAQQAFGVLSGLRGGVTLAGFQKALGQLTMQVPVRNRMNERLDLAGRLMRDDAPRDRQVLAPGAVVVVEINDPWLKPEQRATLASVVLEHLVTEAKARGIPLLLCFDEAHNILISKMILLQLEVLAKQRRHHGVSLCVIDQDLLRLPQTTLSQASLMIMHRSAGQENLRHHQKAHPLWRDLDSRRLADLKTGRAYVLAAKGLLHEEVAHFLEAPRLLDIRDRVSQHGGHMRTAVKPE